MLSFCSFLYFVHCVSLATLIYFNGYRVVNRFICLSCATVCCLQPIRSNGDYCYTNRKLPSKHRLAPPKEPPIQLLPFNYGRKFNITADKRWEIACWCQKTVNTKLPSDHHRPECPLLFTNYTSIKHHCLVQFVQRIPVAQLLVLKYLVTGLLCK